MESADLLAGVGAGLQIEMLRDPFLPSRRPLATLQQSPLASLAQ